MKRNDNDYRKTPEKYSREWQEEYRMWYEKWRRDHWNNTFREIRKRRKNR